MTYMANGLDRLSRHCREQTSDRIRGRESFSDRKPAHQIGRQESSLAFRRVTRTSSEETGSVLQPHMKRRSGAGLGFRADVAGPQIHIFEIPLRDSCSRDFDSSAFSYLKNIGSGRFLHEDFQSAVAVDERGRLLRLPFAVIGDKAFDDLFADPNGQLPAFRDLMLVFKVLQGQIRDEITESINMLDPPYQSIALSPWFND